MVSQIGYAVLKVFCHSCGVTNGLCCASVTISQISYDMLTVLWHSCCVTVVVSHMGYAVLVK